jgi:hypothetical protein
MNSFSLSFRHSELQDFRQAGYGLLTALCLAVLTLPMASFAGAGGSLGLASSLQGVLDYLQSDVAELVMFIALIGVLGGIIVRSQRSESIGGLASVAAAFVVLLNIDGITSILGTSTTTAMASETTASAQAVLFSLPL